MVAFVVVSMSLGCTSVLGADVGTKLLDEGKMLPANWERMNMQEELKLKVVVFLMKE